MTATVKNLAMLAVMVGAASLASANSFTIGINPTASYGTPVFGVASAPTILSLSTLAADLGVGSLTPGTSITFNAVGSICFNPTVQNCSSGSNTNEVPVGSIPNPIIGGFLTAGGLGAGFISTASTTPCNTGAGPGSCGSGTGDWTADFANDFIVTAAGTGTIIIPAGATSIVFVFRDDLYSDNSDHSETFGVQATVTPAVPEPATYGMMIAGLSALVGFGRYRRR
ncbi:MAG TPA: PEP-CTERM sorting domain-containing protein [Bryobacteraceae bacterium]|nr:PEP-CTERM sorting domain-containing protein [Bryobacteraceae bacterium]